MTAANKRSSKRNDQFQILQSSSGCIRMSNVPVLLEVFIYNYRNFNKRDLVINCTKADDEPK